MFGRLKAIIKKEFRQTFRDPRMRMMIFVTPIFQVLIFGYAATTDVNHVPTAIYDLDNTRQSRDLIRAFTSSNYFTVKQYITDDSQLNEVFDHSVVNTVIRINHGFAQDVLGNNNPKVQFIVDGTDSNISAVVLGYAAAIIQRYSRDLSSQQIDIILQKVGSMPSVDLRTRAWFNENLLSRNFYIPGVIAMIVSLMSLMLTSMAIVREKEIGTIEQLIVSPLTPIGINHRQTHPIRGNRHIRSRLRHIGRRPVVQNPHPRQSPAALDIHPHLPARQFGRGPAHLDNLIHPAAGADVNLPVLFARQPALRLHFPHSEYADAHPVHYNSQSSAVLHSHPAGHIPQRHRHGYPLASDSRTIDYGDIDFDHQLSALP